jgi:GR25 family glycosyltransferase involved in LPS biosynthesis
MELYNYLSAQFLKNPTEHNAINIIRCLRTDGMNNTVLLIGEFLSSLFPNYLDIMDELALCSYYNNNSTLAFDYHTRQLSARGITESHANKLLFNQHFSINHVADRYIHYDINIVNQIVKRKSATFPLLTLSITTCKRFELFEKTMNSILNCFVDIDKIDFWICVDDNSSEEDRKKMKELYPFFTFHFKSPEEKGHPQSMNIIRDKVVTPYLFHLEDDWKFFERRSYITDCLDVLSSNHMIGQCLINKNYAEISDDIDIKGGIFHTTHYGVRYYIHEHCKNNEETQKWVQKHGGCKSSNYWPHFSFRPSIIKTNILKDLGEFDVMKSHFEMDYAWRYINKGYVSAFLEGIYCLHIGRLTSERDDMTKLNAYALNGECQFEGKEEQLKKKKNNMRCLFNSPTDLASAVKTFVVNLDNRPDRWELFQKNDLGFLNYQRYSAVDGKQLLSTCQLQQIFENNDYRMRRGMVGCFMSHVKLHCELIHDNNADAYLILEDDITITNDFQRKYNILLQKLFQQEDEWDFCFLGHHLRNLDTQDIYYNKDKDPEIEKMNTYQSFILSLGGTTGYIISKAGAKRFLDFLNSTGATNGIDTCIQKSADKLNVYYPTPHLIFSECCRHDSEKVDSDIQYDYSYLEKSIDERIKDEVKFYQEENKVLIHIYEFENVQKYCVKKEITHPSYYSDDKSKIQEIQKSCIHPYYMVGDQCIFIVPEKMNRYFHRYKNNDVYSVGDAIKYC